MVNKRLAKEGSAPVDALCVFKDSAVKAGPSPRWLKGRLRRLLKLLGIRSAQVNIILIADAKMAEIHKTFSGLPGTTDVLTFDLTEPCGRRKYKQELAGEVYVCVDEARRRCKHLGHGLSNEVLLYALHGVLHLVGYDDHDPADYRRMHAKEDELLEQAGIGRVFGKGDGAGLFLRGPSSGGGSEGRIKKARRRPG